MEEKRKAGFALDLLPLKEKYVSFSGARAAKENKNGAGQKKIK